jgi:hypothetical protein
MSSAMDGQWDISISMLRASLETIIFGPKTIEAFEVNHVVRQVMALNARKIYRHGNTHRW